MELSASSSSCRRRFSSSSLALLRAISASMASWRSRSARSKASRRSRSSRSMASRLARSAAARASRISRSCSSRALWCKRASSAIMHLNSRASIACSWARRSCSATVAARSSNPPAFSRTKARHRAIISSMRVAASTSSSSALESPWKSRINGHSLDFKYRCCFSEKQTMCSRTMFFNFRPIFGGTEANFLLETMLYNSPTEALPSCAARNALLSHFGRRSAFNARATLRSTSTSSTTFSSTTFLLSGRRRDTTSAGNRLFNGFASSPDGKRMEWRAEAIGEARPRQTTQCAATR
mmetsp:Transcript_22156/g.62108  ORF Transcript_22156/g.62108 Transcript_22156/m.62108 type:complete len:295 (-) Transcript_22156:5-889(-)